MLMAIASTALFLFWQIAILLAAGRIALAASRDAKSPAEEFFAIMVSAAMIIEGVAASALSFAHANSIPAYAAVAVPCLAFSARRTVLAELRNTPPQTQAMRHFARMRSSPAALAIYLLLPCD